MLDSTLRGGQTALHQWRMWGQLARRFSLTTVITTLLMTGFLCYRNFSQMDWYQVVKFSEAYVKTHFIPLNEKMSVIYHTPGDSKAYHYKPETFFYSEWGQYQQSRLWRKAQINAFWGLGAGIIATLTLAWFWYRGGRKNHAPLFLRGTTQVSTHQLNRAIKKHNRQQTWKRWFNQAPTEQETQFTLAQISLPTGFQYRHTLFCGSPGCGKTQGLLSLMRQVRHHGEKALVYDIDQAFLNQFFRPGYDLILNPHDSRHVNWNLWQEGHERSDFRRMAESLIPDTTDSAEPFWRQAARLLLSETLQKLDVPGVTTAHLLQALFHDDEGLRQVLEKSVISSLIAGPVDNKVLLSIKATLAIYCDGLNDIKEDSEKPLFSIRDWLQQPDDRWLFIVTTPNEKATLIPLISLWINTTIQHLLSLNTQIPLWFFIDEFPSLHKLPSIMDFLSRGRKFKGALVAAVQSLAQLESVYGPKDSEVLMGLFGTWLQYRVGDMYSAEKASHILGHQEVLRHQEGISYGASDTRDGVNIQQQRQHEALVLPTEIMKLRDMEAFLKVPGHFPITKIKLNYQK